MKKYTLILILTAMLSLAFGQFSLDLETGAAFTGYNDLRIPNNDANTRFSFTKDLSSPVVMFGRANLHYRITPRHELSLLYSPFTIKPKGTLDFPVTFMDETFASGKKIDAIYRFDSYRLQYLYRFKNQNIGIRALGLTMKLRDAEISLKNSETKATKVNTGFVPLIGFEFGYDLSEEFALLFKGEALASPYGRAEDVLLALTYQIDDRYTLFGGLRLLEGGSDIDEVYTFSNINYISLGTQMRF